MKPLKQIVILLCALVASIVEVIKGPIMFGNLAIPEESRMALTLGTSLLLLFVGVLYVFLDITNSLKEDFERFRSETLAAVKSVTAAGPTVCYDGVDALIILAERLQIAKLALNTRFTPKEFGAIYVPQTSVWNAAIAKNLKRGLIFREVVSNSGLDSARTLMEMIKSLRQTKGMYKGIKTDVGHQSFMNFIVLQLKDNTKEVWFGWVLTKGTHLEKNCFKSNDAELISMFEDWHNGLMASGIPIE